MISYYELTKDIEEKGLEELEKEIMLFFEAPRKGLKNEKGEEMKNIEEYDLLELMKKMEREMPLFWKIKIIPYKILVYIYFKKIVIKYKIEQIKKGAKWKK